MKLSKSAINHRLRRLVEVADTISAANEPAGVRSRSA
jgi:DNA-binding transcriptional regulator WhiA